MIISFTGDATVDPCIFHRQKGDLNREKPPYQRSVVNLLMVAAPGLCLMFFLELLQTEDIAIRTAVSIAIRKSCPFPARISD